MGGFHFVGEGLLHATKVVCSTLNEIPIPHLSSKGKGLIVEDRVERL